MTLSDYSTPIVRERVLVNAHVTATQQLSPLMLRLTFSSPELVGQAAISCADTYMKLIVEDAATGTAVMRSYTVRRHDPELGTVDIDFALHGKGGFAAPWAMQATVGSKVQFKGIGGGYNPAPQAPWHLLIGDDSALPAIAAAVDKLAQDARGLIILEGPSRAALLGDDYDLNVPAGVEIKVVSGTEAVEQSMSEAFEQWQGTPHVFLHGEAAMIRDLRRVLRAKHQVDLKALSASGYWRAGATDEQWREMKRDFVQDQEAAEAAALAAAGV